MGKNANPDSPARYHRGLKYVIVTNMISMSAVIDTVLGFVRIKKIKTLADGGKPSKLIVCKSPGVNIENTGDALCCIIRQSYLSCHCVKS